MRFMIRYTPGVRAAYIYMGGDHRVITRTVNPGDDDETMIDLDENGQVVGIELLGVDEPVVHIMDDSDERPEQTLRVRRDIL